MSIKQYKVCRRLGSGIYEKCQTQKFVLSEARRIKAAGRGKRPKRPSDYGLQLIEKQKARFTYGVKEKQFARYVKESLGSAKKDTTPAKALYQKLEERLDNVVYRMGLASTRRLARQMVAHGHFVVNKKRTKVPSQRIVEGDVIVVREGSRKTALFTDMATKLKNYKQPAWLAFAPDAFEGTRTGNPAPDELWTNQLQSIIEFYSRA